MQNKDYEDSGVDRDKSALVRVSQAVVRIGEP